MPTRRPFRQVAEFWFSAAKTRIAPQANQLQRSLDDLVRILCRLEPTSQAIDAHRDELTIAASRQRREMLGRVLHGDASRRLLPNASLRIGEIQVQRVLSSLLRSDTVAIRGGVTSSLAT
jgi:hypothetical protein